MSKPNLLSLTLIAAFLAAPVSALADNYHPGRGVPVGPGWGRALPPPPVRPMPGRPFPGRPLPGRPLPGRPLPPPPVVRPVPPILGGIGQPGGLLGLGTPPPANNTPEEVDTAGLVSGAILGLGCDRAGEALRRISNSLLANARLANEREPRDIPGAPTSRAREEMRRRWRSHLNNPVFWQKVWNRMAEMYRGCNLQCFDDGEAIGQISGTGYCAASVGVGGLDGPGAAFQAPLPLCQNATFTGCQVGYDKAAGSYDGCSTYTSGGYTSIYNEFKSQDCHMD